MRKILLLIIAIMFYGVAQAETVVRIAPLTTSIKSSNITAGTAPTALPTTALVGRENITIYNNGSSTLYIGGSTVTTSTGYPLTTSIRNISLDLDNSVVIYGIVASGTCDVRVLEVK